MKGKTTKTDSGDTMRSEYDFSEAERGRHHRRYVASSNVVVLDADVAARFKNARTVNETPRSLLRLAESAGESTASK